MKPDPVLPKTFDSVQQLRAVAALGVLIFHVETQVSRMGYEGYWPNFLSSGVDVFFVISGFIMWVTTCGKNVTPAQFISNRITRIVPLYWIVTTFSLLILVVRPEWMQSGALNWPHVIGSYLFVPMVHPVKLTSMEPLVFAGWTLNYEMMFYTVFACALLLPPGRRLVATTLVLAIAAAVRLTAPEPLSLTWFYSHDIILEFGFGVIIGWFITEGRSLPSSGSYILIVLGAVVLAVFAANPDIDVLRVLVRGIPSALIVLGAVALDVNGVRIKAPIVNYLGDASYSIYLMHGIALSAFTQLWRRLLPDALVTSYLAFAVVGIVIATLAGVVVYELVEKPIAESIKRRRNRRRVSSVIREGI